MYYLKDPQGIWYLNRIKNLVSVQFMYTIDDLTFDKTYVNLKSLTVSCTFRKYFNELNLPNLEVLALHSCNTLVGISV